ncbi:serine hydrolase domain-containing protein [Allostreptomyces psammosilenae]|uniref:CubicO group peptidase (Beta-lactamase class C family) n=1 Tax=Allostreptomyces psammosilenae TaxID=1892865 RepID=A0A852ZR30_9ACTN|nr:serine hydrolase domain-containing protein [Allostreptomyces psammosilenae]NYI04205.1 CubicO group peptidase (beta-lactamase class C family) [Allostreptomyces psammosilenae]
MPAADQLLPSTERALLRRLAVAQVEGRVPSVLAAVIRDGRTVWTGARGRVDGRPPTPDTQYRIGSTTKTFTAVLVMRLRDAGLLDLADPLDRHLPGTAAGDRTIAQLLSHTGGLATFPPGGWPRVPGPTELPTGPELLIERAGRRYHYSNLAFALLGRVVERLRGTSWADAVSGEILKPLGLADTTTAPRAPHATGWAVHPWAETLVPEPAAGGGAMAPAGDLWSTLTDLTRWAVFLGGDTGEVLHPDTLAEMREPAVVEDGDEWSLGFGLGLQLLRVGGRRIVGQPGGAPGFLTTVWADPAERTGAVFLANTSSGVSPSLATDLLGILAEREPAVPAEWLPREVAPDLLELTGYWYWGPRPHVLRIRRDGLLDLGQVNVRTRPSRFRARPCRFRAEPDGTWTGLDGGHAGDTLRVVRAPDGTPTALDLGAVVLTRQPCAEVP